MAAGVSGGTIGQWARNGYIRASQSESGEYPRIYSYQDVAEAIIVHELLDRGVPLRVLWPVIEALREQWGAWPLQHASLETVSAPDITLASLLVGEGALRAELGAHGWQLVEHTTLNLERVAAKFIAEAGLHGKCPTCGTSKLTPTSSAAAPPSEEGECPSRWSPS